MPKLLVGIKGQATVTVTNENTALAMNSGKVNVFATPAMVGLMEKAAFSSVESFMEPGYTTVGTRIEVKHLSATPISIRVTAFSKLIEIYGNRLVFDVEAHDETGLVGAGKHERFIVEQTGFIERTESKSKGTEKANQ